MEKVVSNALLADGVSVQSQRQNVHGRILHERIDGNELHDVQQRWIDANDSRRARFSHLQRVVAVATTDIEHAAAVERTDSVCDARPLDITAPFAVDLDATNVEWALPPGCQP